MFDQHAHRLVVKRQAAQVLSSMKVHGFVTV
jgi:hypothetical protein